MNGIKEKGQKKDYKRNETKAIRFFNSSIYAKASPFCPL